MNDTNFLSKQEHLLKSAWKAFFNIIKQEQVPTPARYANEFEKIVQKEKVRETFIELIEKTANTLQEVSTRLREMRNYSLEEIKNALIEEAKKIEQYEERMRELERQLRFLRKENFTDPLTGLWNRKGLEKFFEDEVKPKILEKDFVLAFLDLNKFKYINDTYGHNEGDETLKTFAKFLQNNLKGRDFISRYAGDEFIVILADISLSNAVRLMKELMNMPLLLPSNKNELITFSVGLTNIIGNDSLQGAIKRADKAMYRCKKETQEVEYGV